MAISRRWRIRPEQVAYAGLKDRHAVTVQHVTIHHGPRRDLKQTSLQLTYLGQVARPIASKDITANRFCIVLRDLSPDEAARACQALPAVRRDGLPNYFDQQRFGSVGALGRVCRPRVVCRRLRTCGLARPGRSQSSRPARTAGGKRVAPRALGELAAPMEQSRDLPAHDVLAYLAGHPGDSRRAMARFRPQLRSLFLAAYQSHLWNRMLAELIRDHCPSGQRVDVDLGGRSVPFFRGLSGAQRVALAGIELPLPSARVRHEVEPWRGLLDRVLAGEGLALGQLRVKYPRDSFFSRGSRAAVFAVDRLEHEVGSDEQCPGRRKLVLRLELPRGCYATIVTRRIALG